MSIVSNLPININSTNPTKNLQRVPTIISAENRQKISDCVAKLKTLNKITKVPEKTTKILDKTNEVSEKITKVKLVVRETKATPQVIKINPTGINVPVKPMVSKKENTKYKIDEYTNGLFTAIGILGVALSVSGLTTISITAVILLSNPIFVVLPIALMLISAVGLGTVVALNAN